MTVYSRYNDELVSHLAKLDLLVVEDYLAWFPFRDFIGIKEIGHGASAKVVLTTIISSRSTPPTGAMRILGLSQNPEHTDKYIMVMEFAEGGDLNHYSVLNGHNWSRICALAWRMAVGLEASVHQAGLVHGDLHGGNIVFTYGSTAGARRLVPRIIDVGLSRAVGRIYTSEETLGNPAYVPPEHFTEGIACKTKPSYDVYCFGTLMWQLVAGVPPRGTSLNSKRENRMREEPIPGAPDEYMAVIHACW
ncbi:hypothetical protein BC937DRAFT_86227 [Endogone sp. FLAS-F59071]|nr:hypothetical protein BC937DRAFT_86227 [Endogone sp. FLAS-F59071]|eukprot:RUS22860.1 hypothetical protein BC937DRAFT_86227 [Endogone sp. FLAS-F59071]